MKWTFFKINRSKGESRPGILGINFDHYQQKYFYVTDDELFKVLQQKKYSLKYRMTNERIWKVMAKIWFNSNSLKSNFSSQELETITHNKDFLDKFIKLCRLGVVEMMDEHSNFKDFEKYIMKVYLQRKVEE